MLERVLLALPLASALSFAATAEGAGVFAVNRADSLQALYASPALALDARGEPWLAYQDGNRYRLRVAHRVGGDWAVETVDASGYAGFDPAIVMDELGRPTVLYASYYPSSFRTALRLARREAGTWQRQDILSAQEDLRGCSLAIDGTGTVHCAVLRGSLLLLVEQEGETWREEVVTSGLVAGARPVLRSSALGDVFLAYVRDRSLFVARRVPGGWQETLVWSSAGPSVSLAIDSGGRPWLGYIDSSSGIVTVAQPDGPGWELDTVVSAGYAGGPSLALDSQDRPWVVTESNLRLRLWSRPVENGSWMPWEVDERVVLWPALVLDDRDTPKIAFVTENVALGREYVELADAALHLREPRGAARWPAGTAQDVRFDGLGTVRIELSPDGGATYQELATSQGPGTVSVLVPDWTTEAARLRLVRDDLLTREENPGLIEIAPDLESPWWGESVDEEGFAGRFATIAWTAQGPTIAYRSFEDGRLRVARRGGTGWRIERLGPPAFGGGELAWASGSRGSWLAAAGEQNLELYHWPEGDDSARVERLPYRIAGPMASALDPSGRLLVAFEDETGAVRLLSHEGSGWLEEEIHHGGAPGKVLDLAVDGAGRPHCLFFDATQLRLVLAVRTGGVWDLRQLPSRGLRPARVGLEIGPDGSVLVAGSFGSDGSARCFDGDGSRWVEEVIAEPGTADLAFDMALDASAEPWVAYAEAGGGRVWLARRHGSTWSREPVDESGRVGKALSLALDATGRPRGAYFDVAGGRLRYFSSAVELEGFDPASFLGQAEVQVRWRGTGRVAVGWIDAAGQPVGETVTSAAGVGLLPLPPGPQRSLRLRLERAVPRSEALSEVLPPFPAGIALVSWTFEPAASGGLLLTWSTRPSLPEVLDFRLERQLPGGEWSLLAPSLGDTSFVDLGGVLGARYRLSARDADLGSHLVGERLSVPPERLALWPTVWSRGALGLGFQAAPGDEPVQLDVLDARGRRIHRIHRGTLAAGPHTLTWEGRDDSGREVPSGVYFVEWRQGGEREVRRFVRLR